MSVVPIEWHLTQSNGCFVDLHTWQGTNNNLSGYADYGGVHGTLVSGHIGPKGVSFTIGTMGRKGIIREPTTPVMRRPSDPLTTFSIPRPTRLGTAAISHWSIS
jgi:hypothetical protein